MGSRLGPDYARLFVGYQEELISQSYDGPLPCLLMRYIDDIVGATSLPLNQLQDFINFVNNFHPTLEFTHTITENSLPFLDILLSISDDKITTSIHYKETDAHCYFTTILHIHTVAKIPSHTHNSAVYAASAPNKKILNPKPKRCPPSSTTATTLPQSPLLPWKKFHP